MPNRPVEVVIPNPKGKLLDQVREVMRLGHYSIRTEQAYCDWIRRYVKFHNLKRREELIPAEEKHGPKLSAGRMERMEEAREAKRLWAEARRKGKKGEARYEGMVARRDRAVA